MEGLVPLFMVATPLSTSPLPLALSFPPTKLILKVVIIALEFEANVGTIVLQIIDT